MPNRSAVTALATVVMLQTADMVIALSCYKCTLRPPYDRSEPTRLCSHFNQSSAYQVDCPYSTFCMKKTTTLELSTGIATVTTRDCAPQKQMETIEKDGRLEWEPRIVEAYEEGCFWFDRIRHNKINNAQTCYCRDNLCNGQAKKESSMSPDIMAVIIAYNIMKFSRSID